MAHENYGHRARLRERMIKEGLDNFQDHEVLEMLLFQYLPYKDTNKIAHNLLKKFGTLAGTLDANPDQLMTIDGVSKVTACNLAMLKEVLVRYHRSEANKIKLDNLGAIIKYAQALVADNYCEKLIAIYVDHATNFKFCEEFTSHSVDKVSVEIKKIVSAAMRTNAAGVIICHCHVKGVCQPSEADVEFTKQLLIALASMDIVLLEHIIFNNSNEYFSFYAEGLIKQLESQYKKAF